MVPRIGFDVLLQRIQPLFSADLQAVVCDLLKHTHTHTVANRGRTAASGPTNVAWCTPFGEPFWKESPCALMFGGRAFGFFLSGRCPLSGSKGKLKGKLPFGPLKRASDDGHSSGGPDCNGKKGQPGLRLEKSGFCGWELQVLQAPIVSWLIFTCFPASAFVFSGSACFRISPQKNRAVSDFALRPEWCSFG